RGIESEGMMCSRDELALSSDGSHGIIEIAPSIDLSASIGNVLGYDGGVFDVSITPNRGDCFSVKGIARDLAAAGAGNFIEPKQVTCKSSFEFPINIYKDFGIDKYAPYIALRVIRGIKNAPSPMWLQERIKAAGMNTISTVVDLSNLWLIDQGRPLHIYDLKKIDGDLNFRFAKNKEIFVDIKGNRRILQGDMLVAADRENVLCLMGIMGSEKASCDENTTDILIESAYFDPISISKSGGFLNITSDSRTRFERGIDRDSCISGLESISQMIIDTCGGKASTINVIGEPIENNKKIVLTKEKLHSVIGYDIDWLLAKNILQKLGLKLIDSSDKNMTFIPPSWRHDLNIADDLIEEILRIAGYDNVPEKKFDPIVKGKDRRLNSLYDIIAVKKLLASKGLSEVISYSFIKAEHAEVFGENKKLLLLMNPITEEMSVMRPSLLPGLISSAVRTLNYGSSHTELMETGNVFCNECEQSFNIAGLRTGAIHERSWLEKSRKADVFDAKADMLTVLEYYGIKEKDINIKKEIPSYFHPSRSGAVFVGKKLVGYFGEIHPKINKFFSINERIVCFEIFISNITITQKKIVFNSKIFPKIERDYAFIFESKASVGNIVSEIYKIDPRIIKAAIFDCFEISHTKKSVGFNVIFGADDRTLTEEEANEVSKKIVQYIEKLGGELRTK
ncbi:MAG: phenylalanine--tRNA ligase subunit beta, partial [Alphaproteobacteria bacterium]|nr:phenylalanine--tRNA ligase subunit beta [Alphaproteobacteria bacterium]